MDTLLKPRSGKSCDCNSVLASVLALTLFYLVNSFPQTYTILLGDV